MITSKGREIIGKYLLGQTASYSEYLAIGCGYNQVVGGSLPVANITSQSIASGEATITINPLQPHKFEVGDLVLIDLGTPNANYDGLREITAVPTPNTFKFATSGADGSGNVTGTAALQLNPDMSVLDFEMIRVPIISRGILNELDPNGNEITKLIFKAELPTEQRFKITEVGVFSDSSNVLAGQYDSKRISGFLPSEGWVDKANAEVPQQNSSIVSGAGEILDIPIAYVKDENDAWNNPSRKTTQQPPRYFDRSILVRGDFSDIDNTTHDPAANSNYLKTNKLLFNFNENSANDIFKLAYSLVPQNPANETVPPNVTIVIDFLNEYSTNSSSARWTIVRGTDDYTWVDGKSYFYQVEKAKKSDFVLSSDQFSWAAVNGVRIYACIRDDDTPGPTAGTLRTDWNFLFDGMRLDNISTNNPLYGLVGYNIIDTNSGQPVIKRNNTVNFIEFRFSVAI